MAQQVDPGPPVTPKRVNVWRAVALGLLAAFISLILFPPMLHFLISMVALTGMLCLALACQAVAELVAEHYKMESWKVKLIGIVAFVAPIAAVQSL